MGLGLLPLLERPSRKDARFCINLNKNKNKIIRG
jgi:hypothetical protein